jgi:hypothetical protein
MIESLDTRTTADARLDPLSDIPSMPSLIEKATLAETLDAYHTALLDHIASLAEREREQYKLAVRIRDLQEHQWEQRNLVQNVIAALDQMTELKK